MVSEEREGVEGEVMGMVVEGKVDWIGVIMEGRWLGKCAGAGISEEECGREVAAGIDSGSFS